MLLLFYSARVYRQLWCPTIMQSPTTLVKTHRHADSRATACDRIELAGDAREYLIGRESCHNAWRGLRMTPLFGCICPNSPHQKKCDRVYNIVYNNSCLGKRCSMHHQHRRHHRQRHHFFSGTTNTITFFPFSQ